MKTSNIPYRPVALYFSEQPSSNRHFIIWIKPSKFVPNSILFDGNRRSESGKKLNVNTSVQNWTYHVVVFSVFFLPRGWLLYIFLLRTAIEFERMEELKYIYLKCIVSCRRMLIPRSYYHNFLAVATVNAKLNGENIHHSTSVSLCGNKRMCSWSNWGVGAQFSQISWNRTK